jgi:hypothetical protein
MTFKAFSMAALVLLVGAMPAVAQDFSVKFGRGGSERLEVRFNDTQASESWYLRRCQNQVTADYDVIIKEYGEALSVELVNSALAADKTVCVIGHIPDLLKRYMR